MYFYIQILVLFYVVFLPYRASPPTTRLASIHQHWKMATPSPGLFKTSVSSATSLMALQLFSRGFTFMINQALFRLASPTTFGAAAIQFELMLSTILFLSREGVRNALLRVTPGASADTAVRRMNLSFLPILLGIPLASSTSILYIHYAGQEIRRQPHFESAILLYALAAMTELLSEPMYNVFVSHLMSPRCLVC